jgi:hypothetical protein
MITASFANMLLNVLIIVLLSVTIAYCWVLNTRIKILQDSRGELAKLLGHFDESTMRASESIVNLQSTSKRIGETIQSRIDKCHDLIDDLTYMIDKGEKVASKMEASFAVNRAHSRVMQQQTPVRSAPVSMPNLAKQMQDAADEENDLAQAPEPVVRPAAKPRAAAKETSVRDKTSSSLEAVLNRVVGRNKVQEAEPEKPKWTTPNWPNADMKGAEQKIAEAKAEEKTPRSSAGVRQRSQAEQELLDMIKFGIKG